MTRTIINPEGLHDPTPYGYSHAVGGSGEFVFIAGQYGSDTSGEVVSTDFTEQAEKSFENLGAALDAAGLDFGDVVRIGTYVVDHDAGKLAIIARLVHKHWRANLPARTLVGVAALALPDMLFEVDAVAIRT